jgi:mycothiol system anti-sigma-R factor
MSDGVMQSNGPSATGAASAREDRASTTRAARAATRDWVAAAAPHLGVTEATVRNWIRSGLLNPSCREVYGSVFSYLDHELTAEERAEVERHIAACPSCEEHFGFDVTVLRFVRQRVPRPKIQSDLQHRLLARFKGRSAPEP